MSCKCRRADRMCRRVLREGELHRARRLSISVVRFLPRAHDWPGLAKGSSTLCTPRVPLVEKGAAERAAERHAWALHSQRLCALLNVGIGFSGAGGAQARTTTVNLWERWLASRGCPGPRSHKSPHCLY